MSILQKLKSDEIISLSHPFPHLLLLLLLIIVSLFLAWIVKRFAFHSKHHSPSRKQPPSPPKLPILGNLHQLSALIHRSLHSLGEKYGPLMLLHFGSKPVIIIQSADVAAQIIKNHDLIFSDRLNTAAIRVLLYDLKDVTVSPYGEYWRRMKSICTLQLLSSKMVQSFKLIREEEAQLLSKKIESLSGECWSAVNLSELFKIHANNLICRATFGRRYSESESGKRFVMLLKEMFQLIMHSEIGEYVPWLSWLSRLNGFASRARRVSTQIDDFLEKVIQQHINGESKFALLDGNRQNFVDILLSASLERDSIKALILDMLAGGTGTTSATLEWAMTELIRNPNVMKELQTEVREILKNKQEITEDDLAQMQYLQAVIKETLRLHPPVSIFGRVARENVTLMGYEIAASTQVLVNVWAIGRDPASWDEPQEFRPERFLNSSIDFKGLDLNFIPFGYGRRGCPGITFAVASVKELLAYLVHKYEWKLAEGRRCEDLDVMEEPGVTVHRKNPLLVVPTLCAISELSLPSLE